jgi:hypothetical protein
VFAYAYGEYAQTKAVRAMCPHAIVLTVATRDGERADMYDYENGAMTADGLATAVEADLKAGVYKPILYASKDNYSEVWHALKAHDISGTEVRAIDANWTNHAHVDDGFDGTQWTQAALGRNLNEYLLASDFFPPAKPKPAVYDVALVSMSRADGSWSVRALPASTTP